MLYNSKNGCLVQQKNKNLTNCWKVQIIKGYDPKGKIIYEDLGYFKTKKTAKLILNLYMEILTDNKTDITFKEVFNKWYLKQETKVSENTIYTYKAYYNKYFKKYENRMFTSIKYTEWQEMLDNIFLSYSTLKKLKNILNSLYKYAILYEISNKNLAQLLEIGKPTEPKEKNIYATNEIKKLLKMILMILAK